MTPQTRRRLLACAVMVALTVPAESILLKALQAPDQQTAAAQWVAGLSPADLSSQRPGYPGVSVRVSPRDDEGPRARTTVARVARPTSPTSCRRIRSLIRTRWRF